MNEQTNDFTDWVDRLHSGVERVNQLKQLAESSGLFKKFNLLITQDDWSLHSDEEHQFDDGVCLQINSVAIVPCTQEASVGIAGRKIVRPLWVVFSSHSWQEYGEDHVDFQFEETCHTDTAALGEAMNLLVREYIDVEAYAQEVQEEDEQARVTGVTVDVSYRLDEQTFEGLSYEEAQRQALSNAKDLMFNVLETGHPNDFEYEVGCVSTSYKGDNNNG